MRGWVVPPPRTPTKTGAQLRREREAKVRELLRQGLLTSERIRDAMLRVAREDFIPEPYKDYTYLEVPLPLPGQESTISCPHSYPLFYEPLGLDVDHRFLEVGLGSGYGTALAREIVGDRGLVVSIEIDPVTFGFARDNLLRAGYTDIVLVQGDGSLGYPPLAPYDRVCVTAAFTRVPEPLIEQLKVRGKLIGPVIKDGRQYLTLLEKDERGVRAHAICGVLYVRLKGAYGAGV